MSEKKDDWYKKPDHIDPVIQDNDRCERCGLTVINALEDCEECYMTLCTLCMQDHDEEIDESSK